MTHIRLTISGVLAALLFVFLPAHAAVINLENSDFDTDAGLGLTGTGWDVYKSIPGWETRGSGVEVQRNTVIKAHSGDYYVELDSDRGRKTNSSIFKTVFLDAGIYELSFWYHARTDKGGNDNGIKGFISDAEIGRISKKNKEMTGTWEEVRWTFSIAESGSHKMRFSAFGRDNTLGGFIDTVSLKNASAVPVPSSLWLFGTGMLGMAYTFRKDKKSRH